MEIILKSPSEIEKMRVAGALAAKVLEMIGPYVKPGVTTLELDEIMQDFIENKEIISTLEFWGAYDGPKVKGVIATNENRKHICCFFVKAQYQRQGIGRRLWEYLLNHSSNMVFTVNSSPYAVPVYHKLGFKDMDEEQLTDGMRYTPMRFER